MDQTRIDLTVAGLTVIPPALWSLDAPPKQDFILQLPNEILGSIIEFASEDWGRYREWTFEYAPALDYRCVRSLSLVCHTFRHLAQPLLFRNISFEHGHCTIPPSKSIIKLVRTLQKKPELRRYCRSLHINMYPFSRQMKWKSYIIAKDLVSWLSNTRELLFQGNFDRTRMWDLVRHAASTLAAVEKIRIVEERSSLHLTSLLKWTKFPHLKQLEIVGISEYKGGTIELENARTAPFTALCIHNYREKAEVMAVLINWPTVLTHFECGSFSSRDTNSMSYAQFEASLLVHRGTLKSIKIGSVSNHRGNRVFNATLFPNLEVLEMSQWDIQLSISSGFSAEHSNILGPSLEVFGWHFCDTEYDTKGWGIFGKSEASWLRSLVESAIASKATLQKVSMTIISYDWDCDTYPWDRMDKIRDQLMRPHGMDLIYNEPSMPKDVWLNYKETGNLHHSPDTVHSVALEYNVPVVDKDEEESDTDDYMDEVQPHTGHCGEDIRKYFDGKFERS